MNKLLMSLAVFRELYDQKKNIYDVLKLFITMLIVENGIKHCTSVLITEQLKEMYGFKIPEAVIRTTLKNIPFLKKTGGEYFVDTTKIIAIDNFSNIFEQLNSVYNTMIKNMIDYVKNINKKTLTEIEIEILKKDFFDYLLDEKETSEYTKYIASYILSEKDEKIKLALKDIREGLILYSGISYTDINRLGSWDTKLTIYIDTEVLLQMAGYDGELFKIFFDDFFEYIKNINAKSIKKLIKLKYFPSTKYEIESFFIKARDIVAGRDILNPGRMAMSNIVQNCKSESDVVIKESDFFTLLTNNGIELENDVPDVSEKENARYNIICNTTIDTLSNTYNYDVYSDLVLLNNISMKRKNNEHNNFINIGFILVSGNRRIISLAWNELLKNEGDVPLATTLDWLTNKFWFKLNKGFGDNNTPHNSDIIIKSKIILSSLIGDKTGVEYDKMIQQLKEGKLTEDIAKNRLNQLRSIKQRPEELIAEDIKQIIDFLDEDTLEKSKKDYEHMILKTEIVNNENIELQNQIKYKKKELIENKKEILLTKEKYLCVLEEKYKKYMKSFNFFKTITRFILPASVLFIISLLFIKILSLLTDREISILSISITILFTIIGFIYSILFGKNFEIIPLINKLNQFLKKHCQNKYQFDINEFQQIKKEINELKYNIRQLTLETNDE